MSKSKGWVIFCQSLCLNDPCPASIQDLLATAWQTMVFQVISILPAGIGAVSCKLRAPGLRGEIIFQGQDGSRLKGFSNAGHTPGGN